MRMVQCILLYNNCCLLQYEIQWKKLVFFSKPFFFLFKAYSCLYGLLSCFLVQEAKVFNKILY